ncbi:hypothetical protein [Dyadobacter pollutisoli]|jgi:hypothetical protein|uniref:Uncharacterized protein n=1 Tax=Dyadobacter pollutisoli TaxID=2910158 RepID=A0A9E8NAJ0_9BACT|nr:hypothetical protein [Dyadobacter pollutisoli]WAC12980.1 hypothetical protein ON006_03235 [Dyadobacter pollutisoli]
MKNINFLYLSFFCLLLISCAKKDPEPQKEPEPLLADQVSGKYTMNSVTAKNGTILPLPFVNRNVTLSVRAVVTKITDNEVKIVFISTVEDATSKKGDTDVLEPITVSKNNGQITGTYLNDEVQFSGQNINLIFRFDDGDELTYKGTKDI